LDPYTQHIVNDQLSSDDSCLSGHRPLELSSKRILSVRFGLLGYECILPLRSRLVPSSEYTTAQLECASEKINSSALRVEAPFRKNKMFSSGS
ncbi:hypothetical protein MMC29_002817, partial [Sticta canariensis]|nr:hypothetical protein [Sticta canariensis]